MKKNQIFASILCLSLISGTFNYQAQAANLCFSEVNDVEWKQPSNWGPFITFTTNFLPTPDAPSSVKDQIKTNPKDFITIRGAEVKISGSKWNQVSALPMKAYLPLFEGDEYRTFVSYEGRNCSKRVVYSNPIVVREAEPLDSSTYVKKISKNFQEEEQLRSIIGQSLPVQINSRVTLGENEFERAVSSTPFLQKLNRRIFLLFDTNCVKLSPGNGFTNVVRSGAWPVLGNIPDFLKIGKCEASVFDGFLTDSQWKTHGESLSTTSQPHYLGKIIFDVSDPDGLTVKTQNIVCVKGKEIKKISGKNPKCPKGFKKTI